MTPRSMASRLAKLCTNRRALLLAQGRDYCDRSAMTMDEARAEVEAWEPAQRAGMLTISEDDLLVMCAEHATGDDFRHLPQLVLVAIWSPHLLTPRERAEVMAMPPAEWPAGITAV